MRLTKIVSRPIEVGCAIGLSVVAAWWWFSIPREERDELIGELNKLMDV